MTPEEALQRLLAANRAGQLHRGLPSIARALGLPQATARKALEAGLVLRAVFVKSGTRGHWLAVRPELRQLSLPLSGEPGGSA
jgi:hypothetical protein